MSRGNGWNAHTPAGSVYEALGKRQNVAMESSVVAGGQHREGAAAIGCKGQMLRINPHTVSCRDLCHDCPQSPGHKPEAPSAKELSIEGTCLWKYSSSAGHDDSDGSSAEDGDGGDSSRHRKASANSSCTEH
ncbi:hypothetical protein TREES_T100001661 [Tupaia chinensis]|uniref:Uncharacterized protein n=1 Tax=Tupaia chinensis TaxID=246437 RepID=L9KK87_TUPCH|nr:hypothetical protein TREES_T100001661 [Tupaia chinensis]